MFLVFLAKRMVLQLCMYIFLLFFITTIACRKITLIVCAFEVVFKVSLTYKIVRKKFRKTADYSSHNNIDVIVIV